MHSDKAFQRPRVACYCRVSTAEQIEGWSLDGQADACREWCDRRFGKDGYDLQVLRDEGESGRKGIAEPGSRKGTFRPALTELVRRIDAGEFDILIVSQLNRITRASRVWHELLDKYVLPLRIKFISTKEELDTSTPAGRLQASLLVDVAQYQAEEGAERVKMALRQRVRDGYPLGYRPYGWTPTPADQENRKRPGSKQVPEEAKSIRWMIDKYLQGWSFKTISDELIHLGVPAPMGGKHWHTSVTKSIIFNPFHYGLIEHEGEVTQGVHFADRISDLEIYERLHREKASRRKFLTVTAGCSEALLAGMVRCHSCGERLYVVHPHGKYRGYRCQGNRPGAPPCSTRPHVRGEFLEPKVIAEIQKLAESVEVQELALAEAKRLMRNSFSLREDELQALQQELEGIARKQDRLHDLLMDEDLPKDGFKAKMLESSGQKARCESQIADIEQERTEAKDLEDRCREVQRLLQDFPALWDGMNFDERRNLLNLLLENLSVSQENGRVQVHLKVALMPLVEFELPVVSSWTKRGGDGRRPKITLRQLALLDELLSGRRFEDIQVRWNVGRSDLLAMRKGSLRAMDAETIEEAIEKAKPLLEEWRPYLRSSGRYGGDPNSGASPKKLTRVEAETLKLIAAGWSQSDIAEHLKQPLSTVAGTRARIRNKMLARSSEEAVARAVKAELIGPNDPSPNLLLRVYQEIVDGSYDKLIRGGKIKRPSELQMDLLKDYAEGIQLQETAKRREISNTAVTLARKRMWAVVGGVDLRSALEKVHELGMSELISQGADEHDQT